jgi:hypothetical protein
MTDKTAVDQLRKINDKLDVLIRLLTEYTTPLYRQPLTEDYKKDWEASFIDEMVNRK